MTFPGTWKIKKNFVETKSNGTKSPGKKCSTVKPVYTKNRVGPWPPFLFWSQLILPHLTFYVSKSKIDFQTKMEAMALLFSLYTQGQTYASAHYGLSVLLHQETTTVVVQ